MKKRLMLLILIAFPLSSFADDNLVQLCAFLANQAEEIDKQVKQGESLDTIYAYTNLQKGFPEGGTFFQSEIKSFLAITTASLSSKYIGDFYGHSCINKYISNKSVINSLTPMIKHACTETTEKPVTCIADTVKEFSASVK